MSKRVSLSYWSDPLCIWAFVTESRLERLVADQGEFLDVSYRICPVFGSIPWRLREGPWAAAGVEGRVASTRRIAMEHGHDNVTGEVWTKGPSSSWPTGAVVKSAQLLEGTGGVVRGSAAALLVALRRAFFVGDLDVSKRGPMVSVVEDLGLPVDRLLALLDDGSAWAALAEDQREREALKLKGSPTFVFDGGRVSFYGNFDEDALRATVTALVAGLDPGGSAC